MKQEAMWVPTGKGRRRLVFVGEAPVAPMKSREGRGWPQRSVSLAVHPQQIPAAEQAARERGVNIEFDRGTGEAIFRSQQHKRDYTRMLSRMNGRDFRGSHS